MSATIEAEIKAFREGFRDIATEKLPDGSSKLLRAYVDGPQYKLLHRTGDDADVVFSTAFADEAAAAYNAFLSGGPRLHPNYLPRGVSWPTRDKLLFHVYAAGTTVEDCVRGFLARNGETLRPCSACDLHDSGDAPEGKPHEWAVSFVSEESGTGFKASGVNVPGGVVMTWWS